MKQITVETHRKMEMINITRKVEDALREQSFSDGFVYLWCPHTTAGLTVNEGADPDVATDIISALQRLVPDGGYDHAEGNSPAHVMSTLTGQSLMLRAEGGKIVLWGRWQQVFFCEFDGSRTRKVLFKTVSEA
ncbi:MAG: secondary thiamine-phosphate synthase enzyme YjbQ [Planctomycetota bacterium]|nr:secondary thiamine-phosphate synthase enzyme YjbQ [Planctomycetota bacterium]